MSLQPSIAVIVLTVAVLVFRRKRTGKESSK